MKKNFFLFIVKASLLTGNVFAGTMDPVTQQPDWTWVGTISAGPVWESGGKTQTFFLAPFLLKSYVANTSTNTLLDGEVFAGLQKQLSRIMQGQLGLSVAATSNASLSGRIWDNGRARFNNYAYSYKIQHTHVALKGKLLADGGYWLIPWISGSLGVGYNNAHAYNNTPTIFPAIHNPDFASHTKTTLTYTLGAGVQKTLSANWQAGVGYEFSDWGKSALGRAEGQTLNTGLALNHLYTNGVLFNLTYLA